MNERFDSRALLHAFWLVAGFVRIWARSLTTSTTSIDPRLKVAAGNQEL